MSRPPLPPRVGLARNRMERRLTELLPLPLVEDASRVADALAIQHSLKPAARADVERAIIGQVAKAIGAKVPN